MRLGTWNVPSRGGVLRYTPKVMYSMLGLPAGVWLKPSAAGTENILVGALPDQQEHLSGVLQHITCGKEPQHIHVHLHISIWIYPPKVRRDIFKLGELGLRIVYLALAW